jgi:hypothetical protein
MESRMTIVENWKEAMQVKIVVRLMEQVCDRINMNVSMHLPVVGKYITEFDDLKLKFKKKCDDDAVYQKEKEDTGTDSYEILKNLKFTVNTLNADMDFTKKFFNNETIQKMNKFEERLKFVEYEVETIKMNVENSATKGQCFLIEKRFSDYARKEVVKDIRDDLNAKASKEEISVMSM